MSAKSDLSSVFSVVCENLTPSSVQQDSDSNRKNEGREDFKRNELKLHNSLPEVVGRVNFDLCPKYYALGDELVVNFTVEPKVESLSQDWIGLFKSDWSSLDQYIAFQWVPSYEGKLPANLSVTFDTSKLPLHVKFGQLHLYQFAYVSNKSCIVSRSSAFWFQSAVNDSEVETQPNISKDAIAAEDLRSFVNDKPVAISLTPTVMVLSRNSSMTEVPKTFGNVAGCSLPPPVIVTDASVLLTDEGNAYGPQLNVSCKDMDNERPDKIVNTTASGRRKLKAGSANLPLQSSLSELFFVPENEVEENDLIEQLNQLKLRMEKLEMDASERLHEGNIKVAFKTNLNFGSAEFDGKEGSQSSDDSRASISNQVAIGRHDRDDLPLNTNDSSAIEQWTKACKCRIRPNNLESFIVSQLQMIDTMLTTTTDDTPVKSEANAPRTLVVQIPPSTRDCKEANEGIVSAIREKMDHLLRTINEYCSNKQKNASVGVQWQENAAKLPSSLTRSKSETKVRPQTMTHQFSTGATSANELINRNSSDSSICMIVIPLESLKRRQNDTPGVGPIV